MTFLYVDTALLGMRSLYQGGSNRQFYHLMTTRTQETRRPSFSAPRVSMCDGVERLLHHSMEYRCSSCVRTVPVTKAALNPKVSGRIPSR